MSEWGNPLPEVRDDVLNNFTVVSDGTSGLASNGGISYLNKIGFEKRTWGTETSKYPEERKSTETPLVAASERGPGRDLK